ncbi:MAG: DoxX family protein [Rickettsiaceae bacterium]
MLPLILLFTRYWIAQIFWYSGQIKISNWNATLYLFQYEYNVPIIPYELAAYFATIFELACPALLLFGLATRIATLPLLVMTAIIQFTYLNLTDHLYWAICLSTILCYGPGKISIDHFFRKKYSNIAS